MEIKESGDYRYIDEGNGEVIILLHGLFGALSNWDGVVSDFSKTHRVIIPMLPIYDMPIKKAGLEGLTDFVEGFVNTMGLKDMSVMGNSLGGHIGLIYALRNPEQVKRMILTGSSGLFEDTMGGSYPKRGSYDFVKQKVEYTFYDPKTATDDLINEVFETTKSIPKCLRIVAIAKSAQRNNMAEEVTRIQTPTLLIWGLNDTITPPMTAHEFNRLMPDSELQFIDKCCHAPMMEHPTKFNTLVRDFLERRP